MCVHTWAKYLPQPLTTWLSEGPWQGIRYRHGIKCEKPLPAGTWEVILGGKKKKMRNSRPAMKGTGGQLELHETQKRGKQRSGGGRRSDYLQSLPLRI